MGNEIVVKAALAAGAEAFFGYPITPSTEILETWAKEASKNKNLIFLQTEDEMAAGFATIGAVMGCKKAFTATGGPGNVLMQDALSMAESLRVPMVTVISQRGGPSTGTVIYSQQELTLTAFGGNSEGYRIVYSPSTLQELYDYTIKAFNTAWTYQWPTFVLTDGYLSKMMGGVELTKPAKIAAKKCILEEGRVNLRNCYNLEEEIFELNKKLKADFEKITPEILESESYKVDGAKKLVVAHGNVGSAARVAISELDGVGLFRPITVQPFDQAGLRKAAQGKEKIYVIESAANQLIRLVKENLYGLDIPIVHYGRPGLGITPEEIVREVKS